MNQIDYDNGTLSYKAYKGDKNKCYTWSSLIKGRDMFLKILWQHTSLSDIPLRDNNDVETQALSIHRILVSVNQLVQVLSI